jgi:tRNA-2-methylthio-N6-dimethylallyladenosine synthase
VSERFERLRVVIERSAAANHAARVGRVEEVVVEGPARRDPTLTSGRTRQNKLVHFASADALKSGTLADVRVTGAGAHHLRGDLLRVTATPTYRTRIPVVAG